MRRSHKVSPFMSYSPVPYQAPLTSGDADIPRADVAKATHSEGKLRIVLLGYRSHPHVGGQGIYLH